MKNTDTRKNPIMSSIAAISINFAVAASAVAEPVLDFYNPYKLGADKNITLDCAPLKKQFSCSFAEQLDGQEICDDDKILEQTRKKTSSEADAQKLAGNLAMINAITHNGITHKHCTAQYALTLVNSILKDTDRKIKTNQQFSPSEMESIKTRLRDLGRVKVNGADISADIKAETEQQLENVSNQIIDSLEQNPNDYLPIMRGLVPVLKQKETWQQLDSCVVLDAVQACRAEL